MNAVLEQTAILDFCEALSYEESVFQERDVKLSKLGGPKYIHWAAQYKDALGPCGEFLSANSKFFNVNSSMGAGNNIVWLTPAGKALVVELANEANVPNLYGPLSSRDFLDESVAKKVLTHRFTTLRNKSVVDVLAGETSARKIFNSAYAKCVRLTMSIENVPNSNAVVASDIERLISRSLPSNDSPVRTFTTYRCTTTFFAEVIITFTGPDDACVEAQRVLRDALVAEHFQIKGRPLGLYAIGFTPAVEAVTDTLRQLLASRQRRLHEAQPISEPTTPTPGAALRRASQPAQTTKDALPPASSVWPVEYPYASPAERVCNLDSASPLSKVISDLIGEMNVKEASLRASCAANRNLSERDQLRARYGNSNNCEWIADNSKFSLGKGSEATIYMGLYKNPANPDMESELIAIKQSNDGANPFNSEERKHLMNLKRRAGIAQYLTSFEMDLGMCVLFILALDIGLLSLRELVRGKKVDMTAEEKFKFTKALCMAVKDLHTECSVVHRDLRPENVLLMRDGTICITDFGLSRAAAPEGISAYTHQPKTTMQPYEVLKQYGAEAADADIPISPGADVFMLGCVLAFLHQGRDPFSENKHILEKRAPDLDEALEIQQPWLVHLLRSMLNHDIEQRPSIAYVLKHPYFVGYTANFATCLIRGIEFAVVMDFKPRDDHAFRALENVLRPIEVFMTEAPVPWHEQLPLSIFDEFRLPMTGQPLVFDSDPTDMTAPRPHPLPRLAQLLRWHRNVINHFNPEMQVALRRTKGLLARDSSYYDSGGEFFSVHPAVAWLLPTIWAQVYQSVARIEKERVTKIKENEARIKQHNIVIESLVGQSQVAARVLEWNK